MNMGRNQVKYSLISSKDVEPNNLQLESALIMEKSLLTLLRSIMLSGSFISNYIPLNLTGMRPKLAPFSTHYPFLLPDLIKKLEAPITQADIAQAISLMQSGKTPGPDGFPTEFFKRFQSPFHHNLHPLC